MAMINPLIMSLKENDEAKGKKANHYFDNNASVISYSTGIPTLDYRLGYNVNVYDNEGVFQYTYPSLGITAGSYVLLIGKPGTSKTAIAVKIAANIIRKFESGSVIHYDFEVAMNYSRVQALTRLNMADMKGGQYILRQEHATLNDIKASLVELYTEKVNNPEKYLYNTGKKNEFGEDIILFQPTVVIIDSIATISLGMDATIEKSEEVMTQTERMRLTGEIGRFFNESLQICKEANITLIAINQIKVNPGMGIIKQPGLVLGLKPDEACPGGMAPLFNAQILLKFTSVNSEKFTEEDDGFSGFLTRVEIIKSRVSAAGKTIDLIYDRNTGIDMVRSMVRFGLDLGLVGGNRSGYYFINNKEDKFKQKTMLEDFRTNPKLYKIMKDTLVPVLEQDLSGLSPEELVVPEEELNFYDL